MKGVKQSPMHRALELARGVLGTTSPNPAVGCVISQNGEIVGEGATQPAGGLHAERVALNEAGAKARGSCLYVTLEPHSRPGRTVPCTTPIISAGVSEVRVATLDPNPAQGGGGKGVEELRQAGVKVKVGEQEGEAKKINEAFFKWISTGIPFIYAKFAMSVDGRIATWKRDSQWISSDESRAIVHEIRSQVDGVMVGINTLLTDDPMLTSRDGNGNDIEKQPLRIVVDTNAKTPLDAQLFQSPNPIAIAVGTMVGDGVVARLERGGAQVLKLSLKNDLVDLGQLLEVLGRQQIASILVEGGSRLIGSMFDQQLIDKVCAFVAPIILGGQNALGPVGGAGVEKVSEAIKLHDVSLERVGPDMLISGYVKS